MYEYNNRPDTNTQYNPYRPADPRTRMARTAMYLALASLPLCITGYLSLVTGGIAIMMALLSYDGRRRAPRYAHLAIIVSGIAIVITLVLLYNTVFNVLLPALQDPAQRETLNEYYMNQFGFSFDDLLQQFSGE